MSVLRLLAEFAPADFAAAWLLLYAFMCRRRQNAVREAQALHEPLRREETARQAILEAVESAKLAKLQAVCDQAYRARPPAQRPVPAWSATTAVDHNGMFGVVTFEPSGRLGPVTDLIRVTPEAAKAQWAFGEPAVVRWTAVTCAATPIEAGERLRAAEPMLFDQLYRSYKPGVRRLRLEDGKLVDAPDETAVRFEPCTVEAHAGDGFRVAPQLPAAGITMKQAATGFTRLAAALGPCAHPNAELVDLLVTKERVAWVCPGCDAELPADWR